MLSHYNPPHSDWYGGVIVDLLGIAWCRQRESLSCFKTDDATSDRIALPYRLSSARTTNNCWYDKTLNYLLEIDRLANRYLAMRHGHSLANAQGIIVSHPENGCSGFGLSELGRAQVEQNLQRESMLGVEALIICSDFMRARESADIAHGLLNCANPVIVEPRLRERHFGEFELAADTGYADVWREDMANPDSCWRGVESVNQVMRRVTAVIRELESQYTDAILLLVSHGDALQILQTAFARRAASEHRALEHLHTAEIRQLDLSPSECANPESKRRPG